jgi:hypothetical protein
MCRRTRQRRSKRARGNLEGEHIAFAAKMQAVAADLVAQGVTDARGPVAMLARIVGLPRTPGLPAP